MKRKRYKLYTQSRNTCTIYTICNIIRTKYGVILNDNQIKKMIAQANKDGVWSIENGAIFKRIYNWATGYLSKEFGIPLEVIRYDIKSNDFKTAYEQGESFGVGLLYANSWYKNITADQIITKEEIEKTEVNKLKFMGHNHMLKLGYLVEQALGDNHVIQFPIDVFMLAVDKEIYWKTARSFEIKDKLLAHYLQEFQKDGKIADVESLPEDHKKAVEKALKLRTLYIEK